MGDAVKAAGYNLDKIRLPEWDTQLEVPRVNATHYFPIRAICRVLGVDPAAQLEVIKNDSRYRRHVRGFHLPTSKGQRYILRLRRRETAGWIVGIDPKRIKNDKVRGKVEKFQQAVMDEADKLIFGAAPRVAEPTRIVRVEHSTDAYFPCPDCSAPLHYHEKPDGAIVERVRRSEVIDEE
jgi:hypothetical protein